MKKMIAAAALVLIAGPALAQDVVSSSGSRPTVIGSEEVFTGTVFVEPIFSATDGRNYEMASVTFLPGAHSNWHSHPAGSTMYVTSGTGWTQVEGGERQIIRAGDVIWARPGVKHWHGASDTTAMTHIVVNGSVEGEVVEWMERVTDEQYLSE